MSCPFDITYHPTTGGVEELTLKGDTTNFQFTRKGFGVPIGMNYLDKQENVDGILTLSYLYFNDLELLVTRTPSEIGLTERYIFKNKSKDTIKLNKEEYGIQMSFTDGWDIYEVALKRRLYVKVFHGIKTCIYTTRTSESSGIGLVVTEGEIGGFIKDKYSKYSDTIYTLYPKEIELAPEEEYSIEWVIFPHNGVADFRTFIEKYMPVAQFSALTPKVGEFVEVNSNNFLVNAKKGESGFNAEEGVEVSVIGEKGTLSLFNLDRMRSTFKKGLFRYKNPFDYLARVRDILKEKGNDGLNDAKNILLSYYKGVGKKRYDLFIPIEVIKSSADLQEIVHKKCKEILNGNKGLFTPYRILACYEYLLMEKELGVDYSEKIEEYKELIGYYLDTPFGRINYDECNRQCIIPID